jgi:hypothetical protein
LVFVFFVAIGSQARLVGSEVDSRSKVLRAIPLIVCAKATSLIKLGLNDEDDLAHVSRYMGRFVLLFIC